MPLNKRVNPCNRSGRGFIGQTAKPWYGAEISAKNKKVPSLKFSLKNQKGDYASYQVFPLPDGFIHLIRRDIGSGYFCFLESLYTHS